MRNRLLIVTGIVLALAVAGTWLWYERVYWPTVTRPSPVSAAEAGDLPQLQVLRQQGWTLDYHDPRKFMWTPLIAAVYANQTNMVAYLLSQRVDVNAGDAHGKTALMWAIIGTDKDLSVVRMLLDNGAKTDVADKQGATAFELAKRSPQKERLLELLLQAKQPK
jgi:ankyrin repeat protein